MQQNNDIDKRSYRLGMIYCFCEMIEMGVKKIALSPAVTLKEHDDLWEKSDEIVKEFGIKSYLEKSFLVTDLFAEELTQGKWVIIYYKEDTYLEEYLALKKRKEVLIEKNQYENGPRKDIAEEFGRLLSYPDKRITQMLSKGPTMLPELD